MHLIGAHSFCLFEDYGFFMGLAKKQLKNLWLQNVRET